MVLLVGLIYLPIYWYRINKEMMEIGRAKGRDLGQSPMKSALALMPGALVIVPAIWTWITTSRRVKATQQLTGAPEPISEWLSLVLYIVLAPAGFGYIQQGLNKALRAQAGLAEPDIAPALGSTGS